MKIYRGGKPYNKSIAGSTQNVDYDQNVIQNEINALPHHAQAQPRTCRQKNPFLSPFFKGRIGSVFGKAAGIHGKAQIVGSHEGFFHHRQRETANAADGVFVQVPAPGIYSIRCLLCLIEDQG